MNMSNRKATGFLIVSLGLSGVLLLACRSSPRNRERAGMDDDVVLARSELKVPGSIVRQTYLLGTAAKQVAVERLEADRPAVLWSDIRYCWRANDETDPIACGLWFGGVFDTDGRVLRQQVRLGSWVQTRPPPE